MVDGSCLENSRAGNGTVGSNPTLSASAIIVVVDLKRQPWRDTQEAEGAALLKL